MRRGEEVHPSSFQWHLALAQSDFGRDQLSMHVTALWAPALLTQRPSSCSHFGFTDAVVDKEDAIRMHSVHRLGNTQSSFKSQSQDSEPVV